MLGFPGDEDVQEVKPAEGVTQPGPVRPEKPPRPVGEGDLAPWLEGIRQSSCEPLLAGQLRHTDSERVC